MCAMKKVHHVVRRPGNRLGDPDIEIPVAEDLVTEPGAPVREGDVSFYSREYPLEAHFVENSADREWLWSQYTESFAQWRIEHEKVDTPLVEAAAVSGDIPPHGEPDPISTRRSRYAGRRGSLGSARSASRGTTGGTRTPARRNG